MIRLPLSVLMAFRQIQNFDVFSSVISLEKLFKVIILEKSDSAINSSFQFLKSFRSCISSFISFACGRQFVYS